jgi:hypothetical protein
MVHSYSSDPCHCPSYENKIQDKEILPEKSSHRFLYVFNITHIIYHNIFKHLTNVILRLEQTYEAGTIGTSIV